MCAITKSIPVKAVSGSVVQLNSISGAFSFNIIAQASASLSCLSALLSYKVILEIGKRSWFSTNINTIPGVKVLPPPAIQIADFSLISIPPNMLFSFDNDTLPPRKNRNNSSTRFGI